MDVEDVNVTSVRKNALNNTLAVYGSNFTKNAKIFVNGEKVPTTYLTSGILTTSLDNVSDGDVISVSITGSQGIILRASTDEVVYEDPDVITTETEEPNEVNETESSETRTTETETSGTGNSETVNSQENNYHTKNPGCATLCTSGIFCKVIKMQFYKSMGYTDESIRRMHDCPHELLYKLKSTLLFSSFTHLSYIRYLTAPPGFKNFLLYSIEVTYFIQKKPASQEISFRCRLFSVLYVRMIDFRHHVIVITEMFMHRLF